VLHMLWEQEQWLERWLKEESASEPVTSSGAERE
jgi:hypothetical protein